MKSSLVILAGLLPAITNAIPTPKEVDIHLDIKVEDNALATKAKNFVQAAPNKDIFSNQDICFLICLPEAPQCPDGWVSVFKPYLYF